MRKKYIHLIPATLLSLLLICCNPMNIEQCPRGGEEEILSDSSLNPLPPFTPTEIPIVDPLIWDTSNVDISDVPAGRKLISFTFDDAPAKTLENIFAVFAAFNEENPAWKATATVFFNGGLFDEQTPHLLHAACALGFELGNHTHHHLRLPILSKEAILAEIDQTDALLEKVDGQKHHLLRAPFGQTNDAVKSVAYTPIIDWTIDTLDWTGNSEQEIYESVFNNRFSGAIVLMHDGYGHTVGALKRLLPDLMEDGYQVVSISKMSKAHGCTMKKGGTYIRLRKQN